jgi:hypothetical protein
VRTKLIIGPLLGLVAALLPAQNVSQFDSIVDFGTGLTELGRLLDEGRPQAVDTTKLYILTGTVADVVPKAPWFFTLRPEEILDPAGLATEIRRAASPFASYLRRSLTEPAARLLEAYAPGARPSEQLMAALLNDLNKQIRSGDAAASGALQGLKLSAGLRRLLALRTEDDERGYVWRLLLEEGLKGAIAPVEVDVDLVTGEWIGTEDVRSYHALLVVTGPESFGVFARRRAPEPGSPVITTGAKVAALVSVVEPVELTGGTAAWLVECHHIRAVR